VKPTSKEVRASNDRDVVEDKLDAIEDGPSVSSCRANDLPLSRDCLGVLGLVGSKRWLGVRVPFVPEDDVRGLH